MHSRLQAKVAQLETSFSLDPTLPDSSGMCEKELGQSEDSLAGTLQSPFALSGGSPWAPLSSWPCYRGQAAGTRPAGVEAETG